MYDDLVGEFERCPTAEDMWDRLKIQFGQTSATSARMQFQLVVDRPMIEQLWTLSGIVQDHKAASQDIPEDELALNVIRALPDTELWQNFSQVMVHNENIKTFDAILKHLKMEDERKKSLAPLNMALISKESKGKRPFHGKQAKKGPCTPQNSRPRKGTAKKQKAKGNGDKNISSVNCYNCGRKGHYAWDCPEPSKVPFLTKIPDVNVCSHAFVANSLPQWLVDTGATKHIVQDKADFVEFYC